MIHGSHASCRFEFTGAELLIANQQIERRWKVQNGALFASSFKNVHTGTQWISRIEEIPAPIVTKQQNVAATVEVKWSDQPLLPVQRQDGLVVELFMHADDETTTYRFQIFDDSPGVTISVTAPRGPAPVATTQATSQAILTGIETVAGATAEIAPEDLLEVFSLTAPHMKLIATRLVDQTDIHDNVVFEDEWMLQPAEVRIDLAGDVFALENVLTREGLVFLKHAPLPHARPINSVPDCSIRGQRVFFRGHGIAPEGGDGYPFALLAYTGGAEGRALALHRHQRQFHTYARERDGMFLTNTWGDGSRDTRVSESFMLEEIAAAKKLGADVVEIDDGWETGRPGKHVHNGKWDSFWANPDFWKPDPKRFPNGLEPVAKAARDAGLKMGLWFHPDSANHYANWKRDADQLLDYHKNLGIHFFKLDAVKIHSKTDEINFHKFVDRVIIESAGAVLLDLDVTAGLRPGYFGMLENGPLFLENRYTDWHRYWPHHTLRNLWMLSKYLPPQRLRIEFLNNARNLEKYNNDPLAPAKYTPDYLFATTMLASPLGWFEVSHLSPQYVEKVAKLVAIWKQHREAIYSGQTLPIGEAPDGTSWTGFIAGDPDGVAYALVFRELNDRAEATFATGFLGKKNYRSTLLAGEGNVEFKSGTLHAQIESPLHYAFVQLAPA